MEFETVREAVEYLYSINREDENGSKPVGVWDIQAKNFKAIIGLCDLLGLEEIYTKDWWG